MPSGKMTYALEVQVLPPGGGECEEVVLVCCMDKRFTLRRPSAEWVYKFMKKRAYLVAKEGPVTRLVKKLSRMSSLVRSITFGLEEAHANTIVVVAHEDCKRNPISDEEQIEQLHISAARLREFGFEGRIILLFVSKHGEDCWLVEPIADTEGEFAPLPAAVRLEDAS
jgi:hypothetical protein